METCFLLDAAGNQDGIEVVPTHHEQAAVIAAEYYSRISGKLGVAVVTTGPGSTNAITGVAGAWLDSVPLLVLAGQVKTSDYNFEGSLRQKGPQEIDFVSMVKKITKFATTSTSFKGCMVDLQMAIELSQSGRPGPAVIEIPLDVQSALSSDCSDHEQAQLNFSNSQKYSSQPIDLMKITEKLVSELIVRRGPSLSSEMALGSPIPSKPPHYFILHVPVCLTWLLWIFCHLM